MQDPTTLDPRRSGDFISSTLICLLYEGLTRCVGGAELEMALAHKVEISPDGKTYLFFLRKSLWSDGKPVTARDFELSWKKILDPQMLSPCAYLLYPIKNAENYAKGLCSSSDVAIYAVNDLTLRVELETPTPYFLSLTAFPLYLPTPSHVVGNPAYWAPQNTTTLVSNGPFYLEKLRPGVEISLKRNPKFWKPASIFLDQIHISILPSEMTALQLFTKGELDFVGGPFAPLTNDLIEGLETESTAQYFSMAASTFCTMNTTTFPFQSFALRKAFALALKGKLTEEIYEMGQIPAVRFLPPTLDVAFKASHQLAADVEGKTAQEYLESALQEMGISRDGLSGLTLYYKANPLEKRLSQMLQKIWADTLGISIRIEQLDPKSLAQRLYRKHYQIALASWIAQFHDPINILDRFKDIDNQKNYSGWSSGIYKEFLRQILYTRDEIERAEQIVQAAEILQGASPLIPLYHWRSPYLVSPRLQGLVTTSAGGILLERCSIAPESSAQYH